jgi:hypothetical protein
VTPAEVLDLTVSDVAALNTLTKSELAGEEAALRAHCEEVALALSNMAGLEAQLREELVKRARPVLDRQAGHYLTVKKIVHALLATSPPICGVHFPARGFVFIPNCVAGRGRRSHKYSWLTKSSRGATVAAATHRPPAAVATAYPTLRAREIEQALRVHDALQLLKWDEDVGVVQEDVAFHGAVVRRSKHHAE